MSSKEKPKESTPLTERAPLINKPASGIVLKPKDSTSAHFKEEIRIDTCIIT